MAVHHSTPFLLSAFSQVLENLVGNQIRRVDRILAESHLGTREYEDDFFGCGAKTCDDPLLKSTHDVLNTTNKHS